MFFQEVRVKRIIALAGGVVAALILMMGVSMRAHVSQGAPTQGPRVGPEVL